MMVQAQEEMGEGSAMQTAPHHTHTITQPSTSQPQKKQKSRRPRRKDTEVPQPSSPITNVVDEDDASKHGRIDDIDANEDIYLVNVHRDEDMFRVTLAQELAALKSEKVQEKGDVIEEPTVPVSTISASTKVSIATTTTAATIRPKAKGLVIHEVEQATIPIVASQQPSQVQDKGKGKMVEEELVKKMSKKELLNLDEELAFKL
ncbi:hypothetical protein Tco_0853084 [Tanacetum coccineum]